MKHRHHGRHRKNGKKAKNNFNKISRRNSNPPRHQPSVKRPERPRNEKKSLTPLGNQPLTKRQERRRRDNLRWPPETRVYGGIMDPKTWSPEGVNWCRDIKFQSVLFIDECIIRSGISLDKIREIQGESCRVLVFPDGYMLTGRKDPEVLRSILEFIANNDSLLKRKFKLFLVTFDDDFKKDSNAEELFQEFGFKIQVSILNISDLIALELQRLLNQKSPQ